MQAIDFSLQDAHGNMVTLSQFKGKNIILYFYPKDNTPGCTKQACDFRDEFQQFSDTHTVIIGISPDSVASHEKFQTKFSLPFHLLSDPDKTVAKLYQVYQPKKLYGKEFLGIVRSTFFINPEFKIVKEYRKVKVPGHINELLSTISSI